MSLRSSPSIQTLHFLLGIAHNLNTALPIAYLFIFSSSDFFNQKQIFITMKQV